MTKKRNRFLILTIIFTLIISTVPIGFLSGNNEFKAITKVESKKVTKKPVKKPIKKPTKAIAKKYGDVKGCLWEVKNGKATVYLYGSIHIAKPDMFPLHKTVEDAYDKSNNLVVEANITDVEKIKKSASKLVYEQGDDVYNHLSEEGKVKIDSIAKDLDINMQYVKNMKLWAIGSTFSSVQLARAGYSADAGVDVYFLNKAKGKKKILEVEGIDFQFDMFNSCLDKEMEQMYVTDVKNLKDSQDTFKKMYEAYKTGDEKSMVQFVNEPSKKYPDFYKKLLPDRNIGMANKIDGYLKTKGTYFVVVGLGHYIGEDSVVKLLQDKGYKVKKL